MTGVLETYCDSRSFLHERDARVKLVACLGLVACLSSGASHHPARLAAGAVLLAALLALGRLPPGFILRRSLVVVPFLLVPALSAPYLGSAARDDVPAWALVAGVAGRSWLAAAAVVVLMASTRYADLLDGAARLGTPRILVTLGSFLYRYLFVLVDEAGRMLLARDLRGGGRPTPGNGVRVAGAMVAALFLRTYERAERVHLCMLARGCDAHARRPAPRALTGADWLFLLLAAGSIGAAFVA